MSQAPLALRHHSSPLAADFPQLCSILSHRQRYIHMKNIVFPASHGLSDFPWLRTHDETFLNKAVSTSSSEQALWATTRTSHLRRLPKQIYSKPPGGPSLSLVYKPSSYLCPNSTVVSYTFTISQASFLLHIQHAVLPVEQPETRLKSLTEERSPPVRSVLQ